MSTVPSSFSTEQAPRRNEHVLRAPVWLTCVRVLQMVLSIAIFALGIYELIDAGYMLERYLCVTAVSALTFPGMIVMSRGVKLLIASRLSSP